MADEWVIGRVHSLCHITLSPHYHIQTTPSLLLGKQKGRQQHNYSDPDEYPCHHCLLSVVITAWSFFYLILPILAIQAVHQANFWI